jgi:hypothetical protein
VLKYWIEQFWSDFEEEGIKVQLESFIDEFDNKKLSQSLKNSISKKLTSSEAVEVFSDCPKPILPKVLQKRGPDTPLMTAVVMNWGLGSKSEDGSVKLKLSDCDALEVARQLTLIEFDLFTKIRPREFVGLSWMKDDKEVKAPNIIRMVRWSNHVIKWLVTEIVTSKDNLRQRILVLEKVISIAKHCYALNNFNAVKEVLAAIQSSAVYRLRKTKEGLSQKHTKVLEELLALTSSELNFKNLRAKVHSVDPPLIPFPGVYQGDLVFLESSGKDKLENDMINFQKFQKIASYVIELQVPSCNIDLSAAILSLVSSTRNPIDDKEF